MYAVKPTSEPTTTRYAVAPAVAVVGCVQRRQLARAARRDEEQGTAREHLHRRAQQRSAAARRANRAMRAAQASEVKTTTIAARRGPASGADEQRHSAEAERQSDQRAPDSRCRSRSASHSGITATTSATTPESTAARPTRRRRSRSGAARRPTTTAARHWTRVGAPRGGALPSRRGALPR